MLLHMTGHAFIDLLLMSLESHATFWSVHELCLDPRTAGVTVRDACPGSTVIHDVLALRASGGESKLIQVTRVDP